MSLVPVLLANKTSERFLDFASKAQMGDGQRSLFIPNDCSISLFTCQGPSSASLFN